MLTLSCWLDWTDWGLPFRMYVVRLMRFPLGNVGMQIGPLMVVLSWWREEG